MNWIHSRTQGMLVILGLNVIAMSAYLAVLSSTFEQDVEFVMRQVIPVVVVLMTAGVFWLLACWITTKLDRDSQTRMLWWIVGVGIVSRLVLLGSTPILEIDLYRYIWDGNATVTIGNPYKYAPIEFAYHEDRQTFSRDQSDGFEIGILSPHDDESMLDTLEILSQHFGHFTSPYPPVSQAVFAAAHNFCPEKSSLRTRVVVLKAFMVLFDIATGIVLILILRMLKMPETMSIVWFWSPLVLKEFANSGHLDSIAIFFSSLFVLYSLKQITTPNKSLRYAMLAALFLSLGIAAKIYPIVLVPMWAIVTLLQMKAKAIGPLVVLALTAGALLSPMVMNISEYQNRGSKSLPKPGLLAFAECWEMNDFLFMVVLENLKAENVSVNGQTDKPWFVLTPESWRSNRSFGDAFLATRKITMCALLVLIIWLAWRWTRTEADHRSHFFVQCVFLTLSWFWLLSPTQNPWYWCWALPLVPFARSRVWYLVAVTTSLYYLRPWFTYHKVDIAGFDNVVPVIEFAPILVLLFASFLQTRLFSADMQDKMEVRGNSEI